MKKVGFLTHTKSYSTPTPTREIRAPLNQGHICGLFFLTNLYYEVFKYLDSCFKRISSTKFLTFCS